MSATTTTTGGAPIAIFQPSRERLAGLAAWFDAEYPALLRFAYFVTGDRATAEDVVQEAFVRMYNAGARAEREGLATYARTTVLNLHRSAFKRRVRERRAYERHGARPDVAPHDPGVRDEVWAAIQTLSPRQRACIALRYYEDMSERDIARTLGMSAGAVKKQTSRAMSRLRETLGRQP